MTKIELEFLFNCSDRILYNRLSTASGLGEWFADDVKVEANIFTFIWEGVEEQAVLLGKKNLCYAKFKWLDSEPDTYFEFMIQTHDITNAISLIITDFTEDDEKQENIELWETQINNLKHLLGA
ncbi:MAG: START-like domain-containing protein [Bacteroidales bacterium]|nr:START-like domain-containing protein [Bacteroidales bacterium]MDD4217357.1 START-like domain-containing protein [Bacteroidales bacterium]MDY0140783.1 START-like domain-containing protein [Bacteroidales bacterium]